MFGDFDFKAPRESLDPYFNALPHDAKHQWIAEEKNVRDNLFFTTMGDREFNNLKTAKDGDKLIQGVFNYDILSNPFYNAQFQYVPVDTDNRDLMIIDDDIDEDNDNQQSDLVRVVLNLAYLTEEKAKSFDFDSASYKSVIKMKSGLGNLASGLIKQA